LTSPNRSGGIVGGGWLGGRVIAKGTAHTSLWTRRTKPPFYTRLTREPRLVAIDEVERYEPAYYHDIPIDRTDQGTG
jgi:hypothetical protein